MWPISSEVAWISAKQLAQIISSVNSLDCSAELTKQEARGLTAPLFNHNYKLIITLASLWNPYEVYN